MEPYSVYILFDLALLIIITLGFMHIVAYVSNSFLFIAEYHPMLSIDTP